MQSHPHLHRASGVCQCRVQLVQYPEQRIQRLCLGYDPDPKAERSFSCVLWPRIDRARQINAAICATPNHPVRNGPGEAHQRSKRRSPESSGPRAAASAAPVPAPSPSKPVTGASIRPVVNDFSVNPMEWSIATCGT